MTQQTEIRMIENAKRVWVANQWLEQGQGAQAQVQVKAGRKIYAIYRTDATTEGFARASEYAEKFAAAGITQEGTRNE